MLHLEQYNENIILINQELKYELFKLIVVDDEKMTRQVLLKHIPWHELDIDILGEADDGVNALEMALKYKPDIILCDVKMPRMNGIELAAQLRKKLPHCKFIFLSGYSDKGYLKSAITLKAVSYVEKPIDLEEIKKVLTLTVIECKKEKEDQKNNLKVTIQELCIDLLSSHPNLDHLGKKIDAMNLNFPSNGRYVVSALKINFMNTKSIEKTKKIRGQLFKNLKTICHQLTDNCFISFKGDEYILLFVHLKDGIEVTHIISLLDYFIKVSTEEYDKYLRLSIGIGHEVQDLFSIHQSYQTALIAVHKYFFSWNNNIILYTQNDNLPYKFNDDLLTSMTELIKANKRTDTILLIKYMINDIRKHDNTQPDYVKNIFYKIIIHLSSFCHEWNITILNNDFQYIEDIIINSYTLNEIEDKVINLICSVCSEFETKSDDRDITTRIMQYINDYYDNYDLSINTIAESLYLTPTYLCTIFKKETGTTINQYITQVRINKSKEYLKNTSTKLYDIGRKVGYKDGKYFTKVFYKVVGIKPKKYREIHHDQ